MNSRPASSSSISARGPSGTSAATGFADREGAHGDDPFVRLAVGGLIFKAPEGVAAQLKRRQRHDDNPGSVSGPGGHVFAARRLRVGFRLARLRLVEAIVGALAGHQFFVRPLLDDLAAVQHDQAVSLAQRAQAVGDGNGGAAAHQIVQRLLDFLFGRGVHR
ncbi:hypothetical protein G6F31_016659 [Rhizopus arrhizus]|nr:hypothetical protein G6F31_016659 [Rhizopus arrhizus]